MTKEDLRTLIRLYQEGGAVEDCLALPLLQAGGEEMKQGFIRLLEDPGLPSQDADTVFEILYIVFPCRESYEAIERNINQITDPAERAEAMQILDVFRSHLEHDTHSTSGAWSPRRAEEGN